MSRGDRNEPDWRDLLEALDNPLSLFPWYVWAGVLLVVGALALIYVSAG